jgi:hypothetical protein
MEDNYLETRKVLEEDCDRMGKDFVRALRERTGKQLDPTGIPIALAAVFEELVDYSKVNMDSFYLKETLAKFVGMRLERYASGIEALCAKLHEIGATSAEKKVNSGGDYYVYSIAATYRWRYVLICQTQTLSFVVLMRYGDRAETHPDKLRQSFLRVDPTLSEKDIEVVISCHRPQIYVIQQSWKKTVVSLERYAQLDDSQLPSWQDDSNLHGYVAFLRDGEVKGAIHHYGKICYCLYNLASFIECRDELELD